jgi:hypothetical protein
LTTNPRNLSWRLPFVRQQYLGAVEIPQPIHRATADILMPWALNVLPVHYPRI